MGFSFLTRDGTYTPCIARGSLHSWLPGNSHLFLMSNY